MVTGISFTGCQVQVEKTGQILYLRARHEAGKVSYSLRTQANGRGKVVTALRPVDVLDAEKSLTSLYKRVPFRVVLYASFSPHIVKANLR